MKTQENGNADGTPSRQHRIMIVDDHPLVRQGLAAVINRLPDLKVSAEAGSASEALAQLALERPDLVLVDIMLPEANGLELIKNIHALDESLPMVVLSMHDEALFAERALRAGAFGYVTKQEPIERVLEAIRKVLSGQIWLSEQISTTLLRGIHQPALSKTGLASLSDREMEVFELIGMGSSTREIAEKLHLGPKTVETHRAGIKAKLKLRTAIELLQHATLWVIQGKRG